jgi:hypothetical protein
MSLEINLFSDKKEMNIYMVMFWYEDAEYIHIFLFDSQVLTSHV